MKNKEERFDEAGKPAKKKGADVPTEKQQKVMRTINRILGFLLTTVILIGVIGLGAEYVLVKGPSHALRDTFVMTMLETRRFGFIPSIFLSDAEVAEIRSNNEVTVKVETDVSLIHLPNQDGDVSGIGEEGNIPLDYGLVDEDGDGIIVDKVKGSTFEGYMIIVLDPTRVFVGKPDYYGGSGITVEMMCKKYDAIGGINAGGFYDDAGSGMGGEPSGLTVVDGVYYNETGIRENFVGFDEDGLMYVGDMNAADAHEKGIVNGVTFSPALVSNGVPLSTYGSINPRTAIGQRADGAVLLLVVDGRQAHSIGCNYEDLTEIMLDYGAVNACNLDGGSSSVMWYEDGYINSPAATPRPLPTAFLFR